MRACAGPSGLADRAEHAGHKQEPKASGDQQFQQPVKQGRRHFHGCKSFDGGGDFPASKQNRDQPDGPRRSAAPTRARQCERLGPWVFRPQGLGRPTRQKPNQHRFDQADAICPFYMHVHRRSAWCVWPGPVWSAETPRAPPTAGGGKTLPLTTKHCHFQATPPHLRHAAGVKTPEKVAEKLGTAFAAIDLSPLNLSGQRQKIDGPCTSNPIL